MGDLNVHKREWLGCTCLDNIAGEKAHMFALGNGLTQLVAKNTRNYRYNDEWRTSKPDVFLCDAPDDFEFVDVEPPIGESDHGLVILHCKCTAREAVPSHKKVRVYARADWDGLRSRFAGVDWKSVISRDIDGSLSNFNDVISSAVNEFVPEQRTRPRRNKPWFDAKLRGSLRLKINTYKQWRATDDEADHDLYIAARNAHNKAVRQRKVEHASEVVQRIDSRNGRQWWRTVDRVLGRGRERGIAPLECQGETISDPTEQASVLNELFAAKATVPEPEAETVAPPSRTHARIHRIRFHVKHVRKQLLRLDTSKALGLDGISGMLLKYCANELCYPLTRLFQLSFDVGKFPGNWKIAKIVPIFKKGRRDDPKNYRPVALLSLVSKVMERYITHHLVRHLEANNLLSESQFGFRRGHSTLHPLLVLHQLCADGLDRLQEVYLTALDIAGAFDSVWHKRLLLKCKAMGICGKLLAWLADYLFERKQVVSVNECLSNVQQTAAGVPQGSLLGPLLFLIYINDLPDSLHSIAIIFADDCSLIMPVPRPGLRESKRASLQEDIDSISEWAVINQMNFAPSKTQLMTISRRKDRGSESALYMAGSELSSVSSLKLLGVEFDEDCAVNDHILAKAATAGKLVGMLRRQACYLSEKARYHIYVATIRPILEYSSPVFVNAPEGTLGVLDRIQNRAARLFPTLAHRLDSLELRRDVSGLCQLYRLVNQSAPALVHRHLRFKFLRVARTTRQSEATNLRALEIPRSRTVNHQRSFLPRYVRIWNKLENTTVFAESMSSFKKRACEELRHGALPG
jgi:hypothetical protein